MLIPTAHHCSIRNRDGPIFHTVCLPAFGEEVKKQLRRDVLNNCYFTLNTEYLAHLEGADQQYHLISLKQYSAFNTEHSVYLRRIQM